MKEQSTEGRVISFSGGVTIISLEVIRNLVLARPALKMILGSLKSISVSLRRLSTVKN